MTSSSTVWRDRVKPISILIASGLLAAGAVYGIKISLQSNTTTTTVSTLNAARAQVQSMTSLSLVTANAYGEKVKSCHADIACVNAAANAALTSQGHAASMVTLNLYPEAVGVALQSLLDDMVALQKTYLKVSESTTMQAAYTAMAPWPGEVAHIRSSSALLSQILK
jgi:hypothetical protein